MDTPSLAIDDRRCEQEGGRGGGKEEGVRDEEKEKKGEKVASGMEEKESREKRSKMENKKEGGTDRRDKGRGGRDVVSMREVAMM